MPRCIRKDGSVTIIIPTYNRSELLKECIKSALNQTYTNIEVLVVDDASTDDTVHVVEDMMKSDKRLKLRIHESNTGSQSAALAYGMSTCETEYVTWIGSDDTYIPSAIGQFVNQHTQHPNTDFVSCDLKMTREGHDFCNYCGSAWPNWRGYASLNPIKQFDASSYVYTVYRFLCPPFPWNGMWKTTFFERNGITWIDYKGNNWSPDTLNGLHFFKHGMTMVHYNEFPLINYRLHETQDTNVGLVRDQIRCDALLIDAVFEWFDPSMFEGREVDPSEIPTLYFERLKSLLAHHKERFKGREDLKEALSDTATFAMRRMWEKRTLESPDMIQMYDSFRTYVEEGSSC